ncbi:MAG: hypothetical protein MUQ64_08460, partial [Paracoccaceae bacterium]|nr:hypothetical protein [Paracoccaceae bacterium]
ERLYQFAFGEAPRQSVPDAPISERGRSVRAVLVRNVGDAESSAVFRHLAQKISEENGTADIDISGSEFDFVRSIRVWNVMHYSHAKRGRNDECREHSSIQLGTYGAQGEFQWAPSGPSPVPDWVIPSRSCEPGSYARAVGVEWTDYQGNHGYEVVNY